MTRDSDGMVKQMRNMTLPRAKRYILGLMTSFLLLIAPGWISAHDGPHAPDMLAHVVSAVQDGLEVAVTLELTGLGGPLVLVAVSTPGATAAALQPVYVNFAEDVLVNAHLTFSEPPPGIFTLVLDFGPTGEASIAIAPVPGPLPVPD